MRMIDLTILQIAHMSITWRSIESMDNEDSIGFRSEAGFGKWSWTPHVHIQTIWHISAKNKNKIKLKMKKVDFFSVSNWKSPATAIHMDQNDLSPENRRVHFSGNENDWIQILLPFFAFIRI